MKKSSFMKYRPSIVPKGPVDHDTNKRGLERAVKTRNVDRMKVIIARMDYDQDSTKMMIDANDASLLSLYYERFKDTIDGYLSMLIKYATNGSKTKSMDYLLSKCKHEHQVNGIAYELQDLNVAHHKLIQDVKDMQDKISEIIRPYCVNITHTSNGNYIITETDLLCIVSEAFIL
jgi:hypothetical protein